MTDISIKIKDPVNKNIRNVSTKVGQWYLEKIKPLI